MIYLNPYGSQQTRSILKIPLMYIDSPASQAKQAQETEGGEARKTIHEE